MKRICALLLCGALLFPQGAGAADAWPAWAEEALSWGREASISQEFLSQPEETVTRGMAAQLLYEAAGKPAVSGECSFTDVSGDNADAVTWAAEQGYLTGVGDGKYSPAAPSPGRSSPPSSGGGPAPPARQFRGWISSGTPEPWESGPGRRCSGPSRPA